MAPINPSEGKLPSVAELQHFIREGAVLAFKTVDGATYQGTLKWFDDHAFCLILDEGRGAGGFAGEFTLLRHSVIGYGIKRRN